VQQTDTEKVVKIDKQTSTVHLGWAVLKASVVENY